MNLTVKAIMYRVLFICLIAGLQHSCTHSPSNPSATSPKREWVVDSFKYTAYYVSPNPSSPTWETRLGHCLLVDEYGRFSLLRESVDSQAYFKGTVPDSLLSLVERVQSDHGLESTYPYNPERGYTYDGYEYILDYYTSHQRNLIQFIPPEAPASVQRLSRALDNFVASVTANKVDRFPLNGYEAEIQRLSKWMITEPPPIVDTTKFEPAKVR